MGGKRVNGVRQVGGVFVFREASGVKHFSKLCGFLRGIDAIGGD